RRRSRTWVRAERQRRGPAYAVSTSTRDAAARSAAHPTPSVIEKHPVEPTAVGTGSPTASRGALRTRRSRDHSRLRELSVSVLRLVEPVSALARPHPRRAAGSTRTAVDADHPGGEAARHPLGFVALLRAEDD